MIWSALFATGNFLYGRTGYAVALTARVRHHRCGARRDREAAVESWRSLTLATENAEVTENSFQILLEKSSCLKGRIAWS